MKRLLALAVALSGCAAPGGEAGKYLPPTLRHEAGPTGGVETRPLGLRDCVRLALRGSRRVAAAETRILIARDTGDQTRAFLLPRLSAEGRFSARNNDPGALMNGLAVVAGEREVVAGGVSAIVPIYDFGASFARLDADRRAETRAGHEARQVRRLVALEAALAYLRVLEARRILEVVEESLGTVERQVSAARDARAQGLAAANEVLAAETQLEERRRQRIAAANNVRLAEAVLNRRLGRDLLEPLDLAEPPEAEAPGGEFEAALREALASRPDLEALREDIEIARSRWRAAHGGLRPRVYAFGAWQATTDDFVLNKEWWSGGVAVDLTFFDGGATLAALRRSEREIALAEDAFRERADDAALTLLQARLEAETAAARLPVARREIELAEETLRVTRDLFAQGLATGTDVLADEDRLARARSAAHQARYELQAALARAAWETGRPLPGEGDER